MNYEQKEGNQKERKQKEGNQKERKQKEWKQKEGKQKEGKQKEGKQKMVLLISISLFPKIRIVLENKRKMC